MTSLSEKWAHGLAANGVIFQEDEALYSYGLHQSVVFLLNTVAIILVGWLLGMVKESVMFIVAYLPIRRMAGGYHARTQLRCYLWGIVLITVVLLSVKMIPWNLPLSSGVLLTASAIIFCLAPVEDSNKPLDKQERQKFGRRARQLLVIEIAVYLGLVAMKQSDLAVTLVVSLSALSVMLVAGKVKII